MAEFPIAIRAFDRLSDEDFVYSTWMKSFRDSSYARAIPTQLYNMGQRSRIYRVLEAKDTVVQIACDPNTEELIYGYMVSAYPNVLHYVYTKGQYRKLGIAKALLANHIGKTTIYTHKGDIRTEKLLKTDPTFVEWIYDPYILEGI